MRFAPPVHGAGPGGVAARAPVAGYHPTTIRHQSLEELRFFSIKQFTREFLN